MASCSRSVYPPAVIASVQKQLNDRILTTSDNDDDARIPDSFRLESTMEKARLDDAVMIELDINSGVSRVREINVLRGAEMIAEHSGEHGALCFVVRRPG